MSKRQRQDQPEGIEHVQKMMKEKDKETHKWFERSLEAENKLDDLKKENQKLKGD